MIAYHVHDPRGQRAGPTLLLKDGALIVSVSAECDPNIGARIALVRAPALVRDAWDGAECPIEASSARVEVDVFPERDDDLLATASLYYAVMLNGTAPYEIHLVWPLGTPEGCRALRQTAAHGRLAIARKEDVTVLGDNGRVDMAAGTPLMTLWFDAATIRDLIEASIMGQQTIGALAEPEDDGATAGMSGFAQSLN